MNNALKIEILKEIERLNDRGYFYIFNNREDFIESRADWEDLRDTCNNLYFTIERIKELLNNN